MNKISPLVNTVRNTTARTADRAADTVKSSIVTIAYKTNNSRLGKASSGIIQAGFRGLFNLLDKKSMPHSSSKKKALDNNVSEYLLKAGLVRLFKKLDKKLGYME